MTASDPAGGRAIKVTLQTGIDDAESYYTKSDSAGGRAIKVSLIDSGALILAGNVPLSTTPIAVADGAGSTSPLQLSTTRIVMNTGAAASRATLNITSLPYTAGNGDQNHPVLLFGTHGGSIWAESPNGGTYIGINAVASFPGNFLDFHVNGGASVFKVSSAGTVTGTNFNVAGLGGRYLFDNSQYIDGTTFPNVIFHRSNANGHRFNVNGTDILNISSAGLTSNNNIAVSGKVTSTGGYIGTTGNIIPSFESSVSYGAASGNATFRPVSISYSINNTGPVSGTATGIFLNATETALNGMAHNLIDLQTTISGTTTSKFRVDRDGTLRSGSILVSGTGYFAAGVANTIGTAYGIQSNLNIVPSAGSASFRPYEILYTINASGPQTGGATTTGIFLNATETTLFGMTHNLMDLGTGGGTYVSRFKVNSLGEPSFSSSNVIMTPSSLSFTNGIFSPDSFTRWGGGGYMYANVITNCRFHVNTGGLNVEVNASTAQNASAILQLTSTTKGFLPPRMTNANRIAISSPAIGLEVYCTDAVGGLEGKYVYKSTGWTFII
jgi:hypothetical protein